MPKDQVRRGSPQKNSSPSNHATVKNGKGTSFISRSMAIHNSSASIGYTKYNENPFAGVTLQLFIYFFGLQ